MLRPTLYACFLTLLAASACSANGAKTGSGVRSGGGTGATGGSSPMLNLGGSGNGTGAGLNLSDGGPIETDGGDGSNPATCADAAAFGSYVGCDFWPTIVANNVWTEFQPAVVIANASMTDAMVTITGPNGFNQSVNVAAGGLQKVMLSWQMDLKGPLWTANTSGGRQTASVRADKGAYHMVSSVPVTAWQFNPLDYAHDGSAGQPCPSVATMGCRSASVDASLLLPSTAMTKNYRIFGYSSKNEGMDWGSAPSGAAITATADGTMVTVQFGPKCGAEIYPTTMLDYCIAAGTGVDAKKAGEIVTYAMNAGDVVELVGQWAKDPQTKNADLSGTVINSTQPVQVISYNQIAQLPDYSVANADHMEETVLPAEVLGNKYVVVPPTTPNGNAVGHVVRIYGNVDGTHLTYTGTKPEGAPDTINAGDVLQIPPLPTGQPAPDCNTVANHCMTNDTFTVSGDQPFAVTSYMVGGTLQMPGTDAMTSMGDPSATTEVTPAQFRKQYTFLAPADYVKNFADVIVPTGADVTLDGKAVTTAATAVDGDWGFLRLPLDNSGTGVHTLTTTNEKGLGLQVEGFGYATSYYYPGGMNLIHISPPPVIPVVK